MFSTLQKCGFCGGRVMNKTVEVGAFFKQDEVTSINCANCGNLVCGTCKPMKQPEACKK